MKKTLTLFCFISASYLVGCEMKSQSDEQQNNQDGLSYWPQIQSSVVPSEQVEAQVQQLLSDMTLKQKVAQIIQPEIRDITVEDMREYGFGSYLNGGGAFPNANKHATPEE